MSRLGLLGLITDRKVTPVKRKHQLLIRCTIEEGSEEALSKFLQADKSQELPGKL
jgi:hypothetical protein